MAAKIGEPKTITEQESIGRVELFTDAQFAPDDWMVICHFETGNYDQSGKLIGNAQFGSRRVSRRFGDIKDEPGIAALVGAIKDNCYRWRQEDIDAQAERDRQEAERKTKE
jgi:hypothetical protein